MKKLKKYLSLIMVMSFITQSMTVFAAGNSLPTSQTSINQSDDEIDMDTIVFSDDMGNK